jgi:hypothetical protein
MLPKRRAYKASRTWGAAPQGRFLATFQLGPKWLATAP